MTKAEPIILKLALPLLRLYMPHHNISSVKLTTTESSNIIGYDMDNLNQYNVVLVEKQGIFLLGGE